MRAAILSGAACEHCGYSLLGHHLGGGGAVCPECGRLAKGRPREDDEIPPLSWSVLPTLACFAVLDLLTFATRRPGALPLLGLIAAAAFVIPMVAAARWVLDSRRGETGAGERAGLALVFLLTGWAINFAMMMVNLALLFAVAAMFS